MSIKVIDIKLTIEDLLSTKLEHQEDIWLVNIGSVLVEIQDLERLLVPKVLVLVVGSLYRKKHKTVCN